MRGFKMCYFYRTHLFFLFMPCCNHEITLYVMKTGCFQQGDSLFAVYVMRIRIIIGPTAEPF